MRLIDTEFVGDRFLVRVPLPDSTVLRLLADTGGGYVVDPARVGCLPRAPLPDGTGEGVRLPIDPPMPAGRDIAQLYPSRLGADGVVNAWWFTGGVWAFDYRLGRLEILDSGLTTGVRLGLATANGQLASPFPRIQAVIDDEPVDLLLDTGASVELTDLGVQALGNPRIRASAFIVASRFDQRRKRHPDWPIIERASTIGENPLIEVPHVKLGDVDLGPAWFEKRPDAAFHQWMSQWMDRRVDGALGASAYRKRRLIIDYPHAVATVT